MRLAPRSAAIWLVVGIAGWPVARATETDAKFTGTITAISFGCNVDAQCEVVVDGHRYVDFGHDTRGAKPSAVGSADDLWALSKRSGVAVGRTVEVFAATAGKDYYSIYGKASYYVRLVGADPHRVRSTR